MHDECGVPIDGSCAPGFERVRDAFESNFTDRDEIGASVAVWVEGDLVVNLWGGLADAAGLRPWREDTLASIYSGSKGLTSTCVHLLADRGELDLHAPVARYWPEFGQAGKQHITVAMVLGHRSGVIGPRTRMHWADAADWDAVCAHIAAAEPWWEPGTAQGYHMVTFGFILGEVVRRVTGRTIGQYLRTEIAEPLGIDVHIGLPTAEHRRCAEMVNKPHIRDVLAAGEAPGHPASLTEHPMAGLAVAMGFVPDDELGSNELELWRSLEFPATNAMCRRSAWRRSTTRWPRRSCCRVSTWSWSGCPRADSTPMSCWARGSPTTAGVWATCSISAASRGQTCGRSATAGPAARSRSSTSSTASATRTS